MGNNKPGYCVLIVDDEPHVLEGLKSMIDWEYLQCHEIYFAESSEDAHKILIENKIDILITDIRLPGKSGLDLIQSLKKRFNDLKVIVMSGYRDFEYVKRAMTLCVDGYLVKPVFKEDAEDVLIPIVEDMNLQMKKQTYSEESSLYIVKDVLVNDINSSMLESELIDFIIRKELYLLVCWSRKKNESYSLVYDCIYEESTKPQGIILYRDDYGVIGLLKKEFDIGLLEREEGHDNEIIWQVEDSVGDIDTWKNLYKSFRHILPYECHLKQGQSFLLRKVCMQKSFVEDEKVLIKLFKNSIAENKSQLVQQHTSNLFYLLSQEGRELVEIRKAFIDFYYGLLDELIYILGEDYDVETIRELPKDLYEGTLENLLVFFENRIEMILATSENRRNKCKEDLICQVEELMKENMDTHLTITKIAQKVHLHPAYLGQKLHDQWGESFQRRLNRMRVNEVLQLLEDEREHGGIEACAYKVGFKNYMTFLKYFKMFNDTTPSKYLNNSKN